MDPELWMRLINESGIPTVGLLASVLVNVFMFRIIQKLWEGRLADAKQYMESTHELTTAMRSVSEVVRGLTEQMKELGRRNG